MIISVVGQKGGAGKTTTAVNLAVELTRRGEKVLLVDADPQASSSTWRSIAQSEGHEAPEVLPITENLHDKTWIQAAAKKGFTTAVIDCPPRLDSVAKSALAISDIAVLPCQPTPQDLHALTDTLTLVKHAQNVKPELQVGILVNRKPARLVLAREARRVLEDSGFHVFEAELGQRVHYQESYSAGQGVTTYAPKTKAAREVKNLTNEILKMAGLSK